MKVKEVMHSGVIWVEPGTPVGEIAKKMRDEDIGAVPVGDNGQLIGIITDRDITCRAVADGQNWAALKARDVMTGNVVYCRDEEDVEDALRLMEAKQIRRLPVINEKERMVGMLSIGDIVQKVSRDMSGEVIRSVSAHHA